MYHWTRGSDELGAHDLDGRERWLGERGTGKRGVPETCSVMGRHVGAGAKAWADGWAQGMEGEKHGC